MNHFHQKNSNRSYLFYWKQHIKPMLFPSPANALFFQQPFAVQFLGNIVWICCLHLLSFHALLKTLSTRHFHHHPRKTILLSRSLMTLLLTFQWPSSSSTGMDPSLLHILSSIGSQGAPSTSQLASCIVISVSFFSQSLMFRLSLGSSVYMPILPLWPHPVQ